VVGTCPIFKMIFSILFYIASYLINFVVSLLPTDFPITGFTFSEFTGYFEWLKGIFAQVNWIFPVEFAMRTIALFLLLLLIKVGIDFAKYIVNVSRGSGA
jgi:hypothetical protein